MKYFFIIAFLNLVGQPYSSFAATVGLRVGCSVGLASITLPYFDWPYIGTVGASRPSALKTKQIEGHEGKIAHIETYKETVSRGGRSK